MKRDFEELEKYITKAFLGIDANEKDFNYCDLAEQLLFTGNNLSNFMKSIDKSSKEIIFKSDFDEDSLKLVADLNERENTRSVSFTGTIVNKENDSSIQLFERIHEDRDDLQVIYDYLEAYISKGQVLYNGISASEYGGNSIIDQFKSIMVGTYLYDMSSITKIMNQAKVIDYQLPNAIKQIRNFNKKIYREQFIIPDFYTEVSATYDSENNNYQCKSHGDYLNNQTKCIDRVSSGVNFRHQLEFIANSFLVFDDGESFYSELNKQINQIMPDVSFILTNEYNALERFYEYQNQKLEEKNAQKTKRR